MFPPFESLLVVAVIPTAGVVIAITEGSRVPSLS